MVSLASIRKHFSFFRNKEMNTIYFMYAISGFAESLISVFVPVYLYERGFSLEEILIFYGLISLYALIFILFFLPLITGAGDKLLMLGSIPFAIVYYYGLTFITAFPELFFILPAVFALHFSLFDIGFFKNMSQIIDARFRGREIGTRNMFSEFMRFAGPLIGGLLIVTLGFQSLFIVGSTLFFVSILPLFWFPHYTISEGITWRTLWNFFKQKELYRFHLSEAGYSVQRIVEKIFWGLLIFFILGNLAQFGGLMSAGILLGAFLSYGVGYFADNGMRLVILRWAAGILAFIWISRVFVDTSVLAVVSQLAGGTALAILLVPWSSLYYEYANNTRPPECFIIAQEIIYHVARLIVLPLLIGIAVVFPFSIAAMISFMFVGGTSLLFFLLREPKKTSA